jgi:TPR repeat protein
MEPVARGGDAGEGPWGQRDTSDAEAMAGQLARAGHLLAAGRIDDSLDLMRGLARAGCAPAIRTLGFIARAAGRDAVADFWLCKAGESGDVDAMVEAGRIARAEGRTVRARQWWTRAANEHADPRAMTLMAQDAIEARDLGLAQIWLIRLARSGDDHAPEVIFRLGLAHALDGDVIRARQCWAESVRCGHARSLDALRAVADLEAAEAVRTLEVMFRLADEHDYAAALAERGLDIELSALLRGEV